jgi:hypothetical protein
MPIKALMKALDDRPERIPSLVFRSFRSCHGVEQGIQDTFGHAHDYGTMSSRI